MGDIVKSFRSNIARLEDFTRTLDGATDGKEYTSHHFAPGVYLREFFLKKGMYFTTKIHKTTHFLIIACGKTMIISDKGEQILTGPTVLTTTPGTKRAVYGIEDTTFYTVHVTDETNIELLEDKLISKDFTELLEGESE